MIILLPNFKLLISQFNIVGSDKNIDPGSDNLVHCKYYDIEELQNMKIPNKDKSLSLFRTWNYNTNRNNM